MPLARRPNLLFPSYCIPRPAALTQASSHTVSPGQVPQPTLHFTLSFTGKAPQPTLPLTLSRPGKAPQPLLLELSPPSKASQPLPLVLFMGYFGGLEEVVEA